MKVLVTGGSGFVGAALCAELLGAGHSVVVLDDGSRGRADRLAGLTGDLELVMGDVRSPADVRRAVDGCEVVWHLAYINGTRYFYERPDEVLDVGLRGALATVEAALAAGVRRYVLASTSEVYQEPARVPTDETETLRVPDVRNPRYSYGGGKIASELITLHLGGHRGLETVIFRPHNFYGPDMGHEHVIPEVVRRIVEMSDGLTRRTVDLPIQGDGTETRSFCYIEDGARGAFLAGEHGANGEIFHVGTERELPIRQLVELIGVALGVSITVRPGAPRPGGTSRRCPDISKLRGLGFEPKVELEEGLERTARWYAGHYLTAGVPG
ncbi:NAD-dependent epimerase/dehydratase family protein [Geodermatophilus normandii]|uniref:NAD-dependent epimerase/dehydratase family protein n=1 Tax=Geodermatophilus normandii TaxID=1137989 RepID=A0A6P0GF94_9ACTN|nr:NAD-dependent epimerase/dehydratase family protein [Geodermatophilus normandii]